MIVESLGTSGSGKSALIPLLTQRLRGAGWQAMTVTEAIHFYMRQTWAGRLVCFLFPAWLQDRILWNVHYYTISYWYALHFAVNHHRLMRYVLRTQLGRPIRWSHRLLILRFYFQLIGLVEFFKRYAQPGQVIFLDEGFVHRAAHLFVSEVETLDPEQVAAYLRLLPPPDLVLWVRAPLDLCLSRIYARGAQVRLARLSACEARQFLSNAERVCQIAAEYGKTAGWTVIEVDNDDSLDACAAQLSQTVTPYLV